MCGRYGLISGEKEIAKRFDVKEYDGSFDKNYNIAPTHKMPVVLRQSPNSLAVISWGFIPGWSNKILINAQAEKLSTSRVWSRAFRESRCIVPADYFFEWKRSTNGKKPYLIRLKNKKLMGFAGLILNFIDEKGKDRQGFVIITTRPNLLMEKIHNRMPAILRIEDENEWLNPDNIEDEQLSKMLLPISSDEMEKYEVGPQINSPKNNNPEIINPAENLNLI